jgi:hypothetical protein
VNPSPLTLTLLGSQQQLSVETNQLGPDGVHGEVLKLVGEVTIAYRARLLDIPIKNNNATIPSDWQRAIVIPIYT